MQEGRLVRFESDEAIDGSAYAAAYRELVTRGA
jgi:hypothetical protein